MSPSVLFSALPSVWGGGGGYGGGYGGGKSGGSLYESIYGRGKAGFIPWGCRKVRPELVVWSPMIQFGSENPRPKLDELCSCML